MSASVYRSLLAGIVQYLAVPQEAVSAGERIRFNPAERLIIQDFRKKVGVNRCKEGKELVDFLGGKYRARFVAMTEAEVVKLLGTPDRRCDNIPPHGEVQLIYSLGDEECKFSTAHGELLVRRTRNGTSISLCWTFSPKVYIAKSPSSY